MKQNLKNLAEQAGLHDFVLKAMGIEEEFEKFAELIVQECVDIINSLEQHEGQGNCPTADYIKEHFGVEL